jgi:hypothetical protein
MSRMQTVTLLLLSLCLATGSARPSPWAPDDKSSGNAYRHPARDYFFYRCVHEYFKGERLDLADSSQAYILDSASLDYATSMALVQKARQIVAQLKAQLHAQGEVAEGTKGQVTVLATCLEESRKLKLPGNREPR